ncbi:HupE/UreJ family protein [Paracoccus sp. N5]|uniref:HupE/UreJ family protein n=1 Tax=Paracoccus sp. N5 TaxID=1101189 RepID=UPI0003A18557|nr:HupE/UreJ family protein [Paracoccus sp. N5]
MPMRKTLAVLLPLALPGAALAHPGHADGTPFAAGLAHPWGGGDHLLAMVAIGLWAASLGGRAVWALPLAFVSAMVAGGALGAAHLALPLVEPVILASTILVGAAVALALRPPLHLALPVVAVFGLMHGYAHGAEGPGHGFAAYVAGFALATGALHLAGIALGRLALVRWLGAATAAAGLVVAAVQG